MPRTVMSSIMRSRSALTGEYEEWEVIGQILSSRRLQDLRCSGADAPIVTLERSNPHRRHRERDDLQARAPPAKAGSFRDPIRTSRWEATDHRHTDAAPLERRPMW